MALQGVFFTNNEQDIVRTILHSIFQDTRVSIERLNQFKIYAGAEQVVATGRDFPSPLLPGTCANTALGVRAGVVIEQRRINFASAENLGGGFAGAKLTQNFAPLNGPGSAQPFIRIGGDVNIFGDGDQMLNHRSAPFGLVYFNKIDSPSLSFEVNLEIGLRIIPDTIN